MKQTTIVAIILGVLVLVSVVQALQLNGLKDKIATEDLTIGTASSSTSVASGSDTEKRTSELPSSIKDLPTMVGGC